MKKIAETILLLTTIAALVFGGVQYADGSCNLTWTLSCIAVVAVCGWLWGRYFNPVHIPDDVYKELQEQIQHEADTMEGDYEESEIAAVLPDDGAIYITLALSSIVSKVRFTDDAWGATQTFTEVSWRCDCEITKVQVLDKHGKEQESDFDERNLQLGFENMVWK